MATTKNTKTDATAADPMRRHYTAGLDIGNGYVKGLIETAGDPTGSSASIIDIPSAVSIQTRPNMVPAEDAEAATVTTQDFFNTIDVSINSPMIGDTYRRLVGTGGLNVHGSLDEFSLQGNKSKADQQLSKVLVLANVAAKAVADVVADLGRLPEVETDGTITVHVTAALALPIAEYMTHREAYAAAFTGATGSKRPAHTVTVNNFRTPLQVSIIFDAVEVIAEGASAQYAINAGGEALMDGMLADVRSKGLELEGISSADVLGATNTIGVDIGEGTVNFPVFTGGRFSAAASRSMDSGYGGVLENAIETMEANGQRQGFSSRKQLAEYLQTPPSALKRKFYQKVTGFVEQESEFFVREIAEAFGAVLADVGATTEVAYVFGGGSGPLREKLHTALLDKAAEMNSDDAFPVLYLDSSYSRKLNRQGLMIAARTVAKRSAQK